MYVLAKPLADLTAICVKSIPGCDYIDNPSTDVLLHIIAQVFIMKSELYRLGAAGELDRILSSAAA